MGEKCFKKAKARDSENIGSRGKRCVPVKGNGRSGGRWGFQSVRFAKLAADVA